MGFVEPFTIDELSRYAEIDDLRGFIVDTGDGTYKAGVDSAATQLGAAIYNSTSGYFHEPASYAGSRGDGAVQTIKLVDYNAGLTSSVNLQLWVYESEATGSDPPGEALGFALYLAVVSAGLTYSSTGGWQFGVHVFSEGNTEITLPSAPPKPCWIALRIGGGNATVELWDENPWTSTGSPLHSVSEVLPSPPPMIPVIEAAVAGRPLILDDWNWNPPPPSGVKGDIAAGPHNVGIVRHGRSRR